MKPVRMVFLVVLLAVVLAGCAGPAAGPDTSVAIATFNIQWLGDGQDDRQPRSNADYLRIADIIIKSDADVLGVQEIENDVALSKVLRYLDGYQGFVSEAGGQQRVGIVYRKGIQVEHQADYTPLQLQQPQRLRPGLVVRCVKGSFDWVQMVVHLKSTSRYDSTAAMVEESRRIRREQAAVLRRWADSVVLAGGETDVVITGDFNDFPGRTSNSTLDTLRDAPTLWFATATLTSCKNPRWTVIDHVVVSQAMKDRYINGSARTENMYAFLTTQEAQSVSDHCPVVARFTTLGTN